MNASQRDNVHKPAEEMRRRVEVKTFHDITSCQENRPVNNASELAAIISLSQTNWLPPVLAPQTVRDAHKPSQAPAKSQEISASEALLKSFTLPAPAPSPPIDWSLRKCVRFVSNAPFSIWNEAMALSKRETIIAERTFVRGGDWSLLSPQQQLLASTMVWAYPCPQKRVEAVGTDGQQGHSPQQTNMNKREWQHSFCDLYDKLRNENCAAFYVVPQVSNETRIRGRNIRKRSWAALFTAAHVGMKPRISAALSRSTPGLRASLKEIGIRFRMPFASKSSKSLEEGVSSALVFEGPRNVHGFFDFLLNRCGLGFLTEGKQMPALLSPVEFIGASLHRYPLIYEAGNRTNRIVKSKNSALDDRRMAHVITLKDTGSGCPGWIIDRVLRILSSHIHGSKLGDRERMSRPGLRMICEPCLDSIGLGWCPGLDLSADNKEGHDNLDHQGSRTARCGATKSRIVSNTCTIQNDDEARRVGCDSLEEYIRWRTAESSLCGAAIKEVACQLRQSQGLNRNSQRESGNGFEDKTSDAETEFVVLKTTKAGITVNGP